MTDHNWTGYANMQTSRIPHPDAENHPFRYSVQTQLLGKNEVKGSNPFVGSRSSFAACRRAFSLSVHRPSGTLVLATALLQRITGQGFGGVR